MALKHFSQLKATVTKWVGEPMACASATSLTLQLSGIGLIFVQGVLAARLLGAEGYGIVAVAMSVVTVLAMVCQLGFSTLALREIPARLEKGDGSGLVSFVRTSVVTVIALSVVLGVALFLGAPRTSWLERDYAAVLALCGMLLPLLAVIALIRGITQGFGRVALAQIPGEVLRPLLVITALAAVLVTGVRIGPSEFMWVAIIATLITMLVASVLLWRAELTRFPRIGTKDGTRAHFRSALPFLGLGLVALLETEVSTLLLGALAAPRETGLFQPVARIAPLMMLPAQAVIVYFGPQVSALWQRGDIDQIRVLTRQFTRMTSLATLFISLAIAAAGPFLLGLYGAEFRESADYLWLFAATQVFNAACGPVGWLLISSNRSGWALAGQLFGLAVNIGVGAALIPTYGALGAAVAMAAGIGLWNVALVGIARRRLGFDPTLFSAIADLRSVK